MTILQVIPVPDLKATNSFSRISDSGDLLRISSRLIQIWYQLPIEQILLTWDSTGYTSKDFNSGNFGGKNG